MFPFVVPRSPPPSEGGRQTQEEKLIGPRLYPLKRGMSTCRSTPLRLSFCTLITTWICLVSCATPNPNPPQSSRVTPGQTPSTNPRLLSTTTTTTTSPERVCIQAVVYLLIKASPSPALSPPPSSRPHHNLHHRHLHHYYHQHHHHHHHGQQHHHHHLYDHHHHHTTITNVTIPTTTMLHFLKPN